MNDLQLCESRNIPWAIVFGEKEIESGVLKLRNITTREEIDVERSDLVACINRHISSTN